MYRTFSIVMTASLLVAGCGTSNVQNTSVSGAASIEKRGKAIVLVGAQEGRTYKSTFFGKRALWAEYTFVRLKRRDENPTSAAASKRFFQVRNRRGTRAYQINAGHYVLIEVRYRPAAKVIHVHRGPVFRNVRGKRTAFRFEVAPGDIVYLGHLTALRKPPLNRLRIDVTSDRAAAARAFERSNDSGKKLKFEIRLIEQVRLRRRRRTSSN